MSRLLSKCQEIKQTLLDEELQNPNRRFSKAEQNLMRVAKFNGMSGLPPSVKDKPVKAPKKTAPKKSGTSTKTAPGLTTKKAGTKAAPKKTATKAAAKPAVKVATATAPKATSKAATETAGPSKRKKEKEDEEDEPPVKKPRGATPKAPKVKAKGPIINTRPIKKLDVFVFGEGSAGELGLGSVGRVVDVKRPRLNANLSATEVGVVQLATGGMHAVALTHDNKILTWGVNDQGALGRDTAFDGNLRDIDAESEDEDDDTGINPRESTPTIASMENVPAGTIFTQVAAGDSVTMALTDEGLVYGCGTFRSNEGILGFSLESHIQTTLTLVKGLKKIVNVVCGDNHVLALDDKGKVFAWGSGQQNQLGRRVVERTRMNGLVPREFGLPKGKITYVAAGGYHSFAIDTSCRVWSWGLNSYGETGIREGAGEDEAVVLKPSIVESLTESNIFCIAGGAHHSIAVTKDGDCLVWGRVDGCQTGLKIDSISEADLIKDDNGAPRILANPIAIPDLKDVIYVSAGTDSSLAVTTEGKAWSWGFSGNYQTGQGTTNDIEVATMIDNTATRDKKLIWAGSGGQFSMLASEVEDATITNGTEPNGM